ncbi:uncharacterized protein BJ171DRAFT_97424 [Polychytrium aggregatum]|uniref:uncharacterized protein n=1 Tax=Polychytrium aggregatum TaxID=110093 RepID=UPI0022FE1CB4|nr:uncharacterized protein BJ171DRAFT_97424 [Polychytrium aggregatum]KAI9204538.1 hypothetical protein BJ171DRAFT_97424 [Polychytrium aggregatum]
MRLAKGHCPMRLGQEARPKQVQPQTSPGHTIAAPPRPRPRPRPGPRRLARRMLADPVCAAGLPRRPRGGRARGREACAGRQVEIVGLAGRLASQSHLAVHLLPFISSCVRHIDRQSVSFRPPECFRMHALHYILLPFMTLPALPALHCVVLPFMTLRWIALRWIA